jgi:hypothetical protein
VEIWKCVFEEKMLGEDLHLLGHDTVLSGKYLLIFQRGLERQLSWSSGPKIAIFDCFTLKTGIPTAIDEHLEFKLRNKSEGRFLQPCCERLKSCTMLGTLYLVTLVEYNFSNLLAKM